MSEMNEYTPDLFELIDEEGNKKQFESNSNYAASIANMETISFEQLKGAVR